MRPDGNGLRRWEVPALCAVLAIMVFVAFGQTLGFDFVNFDDDKCVYENPVVSKGLSFAGIGWAITHSQIGHWDPLTTLSHMLDCQLYGLRPRGHHLSNVLLQMAATVLLFVALREMTGSMWRSWFVAAAFAIHPLRAESVAWVTERKDVLSGVFFMLTLLAYLGYVRRPESKLRYGTVAALFVLGLLSKSMLVTLPFVLLLLDYWPLKRFDTAEGAPPWPAARRLFVEKIPLLLLSILFAAVQMGAIQEQLLSVEKRPLAQRAGTVALTYVFYLEKMVWPVNLAVVYTLPKSDFRIWEVILAAALLGAVSAGVILARKKQPWLFVGWFWYVGILAPVSGIMQSRDLGRTDRYTYLSMIGILIAVTWMAETWTRQWPLRRAALGSLAAAVLSALLLAAHHQTSFWRDSIALWSHAIECTRENSIAENNLGFALLAKNRAGEAIPHFQKALEIKPGASEVQTNLGIALYQTGRLGEAIRSYREALKTDPEGTKTHCNLGVALVHAGMVGDGIAQYQEALRIQPDYVEAHYNLGLALVRTGRLDEATAQWEKAIEIQPGYYEAENCLGIVCLNKKQIPAAISHWENVLKIAPDEADVQRNLAWALATCPDATVRNGPKAVELARQADRLAGGKNPEVLRTLAAAYAETGQFPDAVGAAARALHLMDLQPNSPFAEALRSDINLYETKTPFRDANLAAPAPGR